MVKEVLNKYRSLLLNRGLTSRHEGALFVERVKSSSNVATSLALPLFFPLTASWFEMEAEL